MLGVYPGKTLQLQVLNNCSDHLPFSDTVTATISRTFSVTMSTDSGHHVCAVLKLYDRRYGVDLRKLEPYADEAGFRSLVRQGGGIDRVLREMEEERKAAVIIRYPYDFYDDSPEGHARFEAAVWDECNKHFDCETKAYEPLGSLQGKAIPRMYAHVRLVPPGVIIPPDLLLRPELAPYFEVKGVLLELISGYSLRDIGTSPLAPPDPADWSAVVQAAVDAAFEINKHGVTVGDCQPRNVVVDSSTQRPFIIDLARCGFRDEILESEEDEGEDTDPEVRFWEDAATVDNTGAIGKVMMARLQRTRGIELKLEFPRYSKVIDDIKHSKVDSKLQSSTIA
ncbi:hypothetical protein F5Y17DRAFT_464587 [Xylariaceae sp. FL0594]|nr:hypothetical protein F5Y17DRAFT_464587 [Xylariaceae sp. FL0594]